MNIEKNMDLGQLAGLMSATATEEDAIRMRDLLLNEFCNGSDGYGCIWPTEWVLDEDWTRLLEIATKSA